jgi:2-polyprenyl-3-methyl-5-hydroxy-6-metoxy-1,4-benzoquinol methylase
MPTSRNVETLEFYSNNAQAYVERTQTLNLRDIYDPFVRRLKPGGRILDIGCGSGRDSLAFRDMGFAVTSADGSPEMARLAEIHLGSPVATLRFQEVNFSDEFDGIWACASLLHLEQVELADALARLFRALKPNGLLYASFMTGEGARFEDGRLFCDIIPSEFRRLAEGSGGAALDHWVTPDVLKRGQSWLNFLAQPRRRL